MRNILGYSFNIVSLLSLVFAFAYQIILRFETIGFFHAGNIVILIPHWSAWFFLGGLTLILSCIFLSDKKIKKAK